MITKVDLTDKIFRSAAKPRHTKKIPKGNNTMNNLSLDAVSQAAPPNIPLSGQPEKDFRICLYWELSDSQLSEIYHTARRENLLDHVAFDAPVNEECFMLFARRVEVFGTVYDPENRPVGFFYLTNFEGSTARIHFCLFEAGHRRRVAVGGRVLDWCFEVFEFKALIGVIPSINTGAIGFARKMGGREVARIPGLCWIEKLKRSVNGVQFIFERSDIHGRNVQ